MIKKCTIIFSAVLLLTTLNTAPFFMINCTETDGSSHLENTFNRCCNSSMIHNDHMSMNHSGIFLDMSRCKCSVDINGGEYVIPNMEKCIVNKILATNNSDFGEFQIKETVFSTNATESPPITIDLVRTTVLII